MGNEMKNLNKTVGLNESSKAVEEGKAVKVLVARDADDAVVLPFVGLCREKGVEVEYIESCAVLGKLCGITVGAAVAAILR